MKQRNLALIILLTLTVFSLTSCKEKPVETNDTFLEQLLLEKDSIVQKPEIDEIIQRPEPVREKLEESVLKTIKDYFHKKYGKKSKIEEKKEDSELKISYQQITEEKDVRENFEWISIYIPLTVHPDLKGDINNDEKDDIIVEVYTEFYHNNAESIYFLFLKTDNSYQLANTFTSGWRGWGARGENTYLYKIEDNLVIGSISDYVENDANCCPSIHYDIKMKFKNNELQIAEKKERTAKKQENQ